MVFGNFDKANCFHIEKMEIYSRDLSRHGVKSVEFVLYRPETNKTLFVEGKTSVSIEKGRGRFQRDISDISQKFMDSFNFAFGIWLGGHRGRMELPKNYARFFGRGVQVIFILVIKNCRSDLLHIADVIKQRLLKEQRLLKFKVYAMDEAGAYRNNLLAEKTEIVEKNDRNDRQPAEQKLEEQKLEEQPEQQSEQQAEQQLEQQLEQQSAKFDIDTEKALGNL